METSDLDENSSSAPKVAGILRLDLWKPSSELKYLSQQEPTSPQPSVDRLSVTFAEESLKTDREEASPKNMDKVHFPPESDEYNSEDEDYSVSVTAIMQRRASTRRSKKHVRRSSSPFSPDILPEADNGRRRSSVFTTSSGDTAITMEDSFTTSITQEQIFENIKLHKEVLSSVKMQPWNMKKKLRLVNQAKSYIKQHEGALQERFAQSHSTRDMLARCNICFVKMLQQFKREGANMTNWLTPWERRIKEIESHFGSVVASYFIFLRWLFWVNFVISVILVAFVAIPEMLVAHNDADPARKTILPEDKYNSTNFLTLWDFEGVLKYSPMFYGWYTNKDIKDKGYRLPLAYFVTGLVVYVYSFVATLRKMAKNSRMSKLSEKEDECTFSWKLFTGWDYMIGNAETAHNKVASIVMGFKEALLEEAEKKREAQSWKIIGSRVLVNNAVVGLLALSAFAVVTVVARSNEKDSQSTTWRRNEITVVMSLISLFFPILFELLGYFEHYHPRKQLRLQLARIMVLNLLNLYSLIFALFGKISIMTNDLQTFKPFITQEIPIPPNFQEINYTNCFRVCDDNLISENLISNLSKNYNYNKTSEDISLHDNNTIFDIFTKFYQNFIKSDVDNLQNVGDEFLSMFSENSSWSITNETNLNNDTVFKIVTDIANFTYTETYESTTDNIDQDTTYTNFDGTTTNFPDYTDVPILTSIANKTICKTLCKDEIENVSYTQITGLDYSNRKRLRSLCWETMFGQELVKLTIMDLVLTLLSTLAIDFFRGVFVRYMNNCWCWDLEKKFPQYGDFKVAENILHLVNNQGMVWMGMFFSPGLVILNLIKLYIMMYLRSWAVLTCNVPHEVIFRASRSNNFYFALLLLMLFLCVLPVGFTIVWLEPSWHCGPFSNYHRIFHIFTKTLRKALPISTHRILDYIASPGIVIPLLVSLILIIYYLISLTSALREANNDLKLQLRRERTEERRKMFQIADKRRRGGSDASDTPFGKWRKLLQGLPANKSFEDTPNSKKDEKETNKTQVKKGMLSKIILNASKLRKNKDVSGPSEAKPQILKQVKISEDGDKKVVSKTESVGSNWSDSIPVIKISKTESVENILEKGGIKVEKLQESDNKIRYVLKKQAAEVVDDGRNNYKLKEDCTEGEIVNFGESSHNKNVRKQYLDEHVTSPKKFKLKSSKVFKIDENIVTKEISPTKNGAEGKKMVKSIHKGVRKIVAGSSQTDTSKTESSGDYKDSTFEN